MDFALLDESGAGVEGRPVIADIGETGQPVELVTNPAGQCSVAWHPATPGTYSVAASFAGDDDYLPATAQRDFEVVDFREDVVRRYNSFLEWVGEREPAVSEQATPREIEEIIVGSGMGLDQRALEALISRFDEADYSLHEIDRPRFEAMFRACRTIMGELGE